MKNILIILSVIISCCGPLKKCGDKWCDPDNIRSGKSSQHRDGKKFRAMIRVKWTKQYGSTCVVMFENMKKQIKRIYPHTNCSKFKTGSWVPIDSI